MSPHGEQTRSISAIRPCENPMHSRSTKMTSCRGPGTPSCSMLTVQTASTQQRSFLGYSLIVFTQHSDWPHAHAQTSVTLSSGSALDSSLAKPCTEYPDGIRHLQEPACIVGSGPSTCRRTFGRIQPEPTMSVRSTVTPSWGVRLL